MELVLSAAEGFTQKDIQVRITPNARRQGKSHFLDRQIFVSQDENLRFSQDDIFLIVPLSSSYVETYLSKKVSSRSIIKVTYR